MNYELIYQNIINRGKERGIDKKKIDYYTEIHHIIPKCLGGNNDSDNLVLLTPREHYIAHQLLVKIYPTNNKLAYACHLMSIDKNGNRLNNKQYAWTRKKFSLALSQTLKGRTKENTESVRRMSEKLRGRTKETYEYLRVSSERIKGRTKETHEYLKISGEKVSKKLKGKTKEKNPNLANKYKGCTKENTPHLVVASEKISKKLKGRTKENTESVKMTAEKLKGRTKENCDYQLKKSLESLKLNNEECKMIKSLSEDGMLLTEIFEFFRGYIAYSTLQKYSQKMKLQNNTKKIGNIIIENEILTFINEGLNNKEIENKLKHKDIKISRSSIQRISKRLKHEIKLNG